MSNYPIALKFDKVMKYEKMTSMTTMTSIPRPITI